MASKEEKKRRRSPGEGGVFEYKLASGKVQYGIKFMVPQPDGTKKPVLRRRDENNNPWTKKSDAQAAVADLLAKIRKDEYVEPSKQTTGDYLDEWVSGLRKAESTLASYKKNIRLHLKPYIGSIPLASLTSAKITALYVMLEKEGMRNGKGELIGEGLSARTVRYIHTILRSALQAAVDAEPALLAKNPADKAKPPTAKEAKAPEMHPWNDEQLRTFLDWSRQNSALHSAWLVLAYTGIRRGELLALRWRDLDLDKGKMSVRRSVGLIRVKGEGKKIQEGTTKSCKARVIDLDPATVALLRQHKKERGGLALKLAQGDALVFGDHEGVWRHPERFSRTFKEHLARCRRELAKQGIEPPPDIRLHDLRHTHATIMLIAGVNPKIVSERLGHSTVSITLDIYSHCLPTIQREAVERFAAIMGGNG